ncbi:hypothetical protein QE152_g13347 [Popillia japonica]|uniref:Uncharacterized protein n=1 Tax=Popillia japonica TaxID=7064 RepID=A0AAW1LDM5_POPJA
MTNLNDSSADLNSLFKNLNISDQFQETLRLPNEIPPSNRLEVTYFNPNVYTWNTTNFHGSPGKRKRLYRKNVPSCRRFHSDSMTFKQAFFAKLDWYKRLNYRRAKLQAKSERLCSRRLWNVYSAPSREWMMSGDCKDSMKTERRGGERNQDFQVTIPIITNSGNQKWLEVSKWLEVMKEIDDIVKNLRTKSCFRIKDLIFQRNHRYRCDEEQ